MQKQLWTIPNTPTQNCINFKERQQKCRTAQFSSYCPNSATTHIFWLFHTNSITYPAENDHDNLQNLSLVEKYQGEKLQTNLFLSEFAACHFCQIDVSFLCVCPLIDDKLRYNSGKVAVVPQQTLTML